MEKRIAHINKILVGKELLFEMNVGNGWKVADVWYDHNVPTELIDCIIVKFERTQGE